MSNINLINASDGNGEAVRGSVTAARSIGATTLKADSITNWPTNFICTTGVKKSDGTLDADTVQVFSGHLSGSNIIIDTFAPGYTDLGNSVGDLTLIKPNTMWADNLADIINHYHSTDVIVSTAATEPSPDANSTILWAEDIT